MRKFMIIAIAFILLFSQVSFAAVGTRKDGTFTGSVFDIDFRNTYSSKSGSVLTVFSSGYNDGVTDNVSGESNLTSAAVAFGVIKLADTGALDGADQRFISLADGTQGQVITIILIADTGGTLFITDDKISSDVTTMTKTGWDDLAFADANDSITLLFYNTTIGWIIVGNSGVTVT